MSDDYRDVLRRALAGDILSIYAVIKLYNTGKVPFDFAEEMVGRWHTELIRRLNENGPPKDNPRITAEVECKPRRRQPSKSADEESSQVRDTVSGT